MALVGLWLLVGTYTQCQTSIPKLNNSNTRLLGQWFSNLIWKSLEPHCYKIYARSPMVEVWVGSPEPSSLWSPSDPFLKVIISSEVPPRKLWPTGSMFENLCCSWRWTGLSLDTESIQVQINSRWHSDGNEDLRGAEHLSAHLLCSQLVDCRLGSSHTAVCTTEPAQT